MPCFCSTNVVGVIEIRIRKKSNYGLQCEKDIRVIFQLVHKKTLSGVLITCFSLRKENPCIIATCEKMYNFSWE